MKLPKITEEANTYLVVWQVDGPVIQSKVTTHLDPETISEKMWMQLAALTEEYDPDEIKSWDLYLVIHYPERFYV